jgi:hypothetical protein
VDHPKLYTPVKFHHSIPAIDYSSRIVTLGSCFAENIAGKLAHHGFQVNSNPLGILFNPESIAGLVNRAVGDLGFTENDIINDVCFEVQRPQPEGDLSVFLSEINERLNGLKKDMIEATHVFLTLGSAWVYRLKSNDKIVANCHKQPQSLFQKELLSISQIIETLESIITSVKRLNPSANITFTVSPVRHLRDGFTENLRSKSRLIEAVQSVVENSQAEYFPSYEIVMDEMRDYRFYASDMIHLNELGIEMVWSRFRESVIIEKTYAIQKEVVKFRSLQAHRPKYIEKHKKDVAEKKESLLSKYPYLKLD